MLKLCGFRVSNYHNKVLIALYEKGVAFEEDSNCFPSQEDEYLAKSPMGKVPYLSVDGTLLRESGVILEYLEDAYPERPLLPKDPLERARVRELLAFMELHLELVVRRLYGGLFFGRPYTDETKSEVERGIAKGVRAFKAVARFEPFLAGPALTLADCAAFVHLPIVSMATRQAYGRDALEDIPQLKPYLKMLGERPAFARVNEGRKAAQAEMAARAKK
ncbi:MAG: glutathione S-transferase [Betaproteobacteria bacterium RIFCSPLOWO2_02_FULL_66_14]|nr:MAG: glutathione S-transferase [Betaproteobacteria bacterium RIFCSPLOWO2_02_FULL_66_14]